MNQIRDPRNEGRRALIEEVLMLRSTKKLKLKYKDGLGADIVAGVNSPRGCDFHFGTLGVLLDVRFLFACFVICQNQDKDILVYKDEDLLKMFKFVEDLREKVLEFGVDDSVTTQPSGNYRVSARAYAARVKGLNFTSTELAVLKEGLATMLETWQRYYGYPLQSHGV